MRKSVHPHTFMSCAKEMHMHGLKYFSRELVGLLLNPQYRNHHLSRPSGEVVQAIVRSNREEGIEISIVRN